MIHMSAEISCISDNLASPYHTDVPRSAGRWELHCGTCLDSSDSASVARKLVLTPSHIMIDIRDGEKDGRWSSPIALTRTLGFELACVWWIVRATSPNEKKPVRGIA